MIRNTVHAALALAARHWRRRVLEHRARRRPGHQRQHLRRPRRHRNRRRQDGDHRRQDDRLRRDRRRHLSGQEDRRPARLGADARRRRTRRSRSRASNATGYTVDNQLAPSFRRTDHGLRRVDAAARLRSDDSHSRCRCVDRRRVFLLPGSLSRSLRPAAASRRRSLAPAVQRRRDVDRRDAQGDGGRPHDVARTSCSST